MTVAEDATTMAEIQAEVSVAEEVRLREEKEILHRDAKADSEATVHRLQEKVDLAEDQVLLAVKAGFHLTVRQEGQIHQELKVLRKERQDVQKVLVTQGQNAREKAKTKRFS